MRFLTALAIASVLTLILAVGSVAACSFAPATLDQVAAEAELIYVARVTDKPADRTYVLDVQEVFRGDVPATVTFEPDPSAGVSSCEASVKVGATYLFGSDDLEGPLGLGDIWLRIDGQQLVGLLITTPSGDTAALYETLRDLPDTAMRLPATPPPTPGPITWAGIALLIAALTATVPRGHRSTGIRA